MSEDTTKPSPTAAQEAAAIRLVGPIPMHLNSTVHVVKIVAALIAERDAARQMLGQLQNEQSAPRQDMQADLIISGAATGPGRYDTAQLMRSVSKLLVERDAARAERDKNESRIDELERTFGHMHRNNGINDRCNKCGHDLRDSIHFQRPYAPPSPDPRRRIMIDDDNTPYGSQSEIPVSATPIDPAAVEARLQKIEQLRGYDGTGEPELTAICRALLAELATRPVDDPDADGTDAAHPAWWRGRENGVACVVEKLREALDGKDDGRGTCGGAELERLRRDVLKAKAAVEVAEAELQYADAQDRLSDADYDSEEHDGALAKAIDAGRACDAALARYRAAKAKDQQQELPHANDSQV